MTFQHQLDDPRLCVPELNCAVVRSARHPSAIGRDSDRTYRVLRPTVRYIPGWPIQTRTLWPIKSIVHALLSSRVPTSCFPSKVLRSDAPRGFCRPPGPFARQETAQYFSVLSKLPLTNPCPSGVNATLHTRCVCPRSVSSNSPVRASQTRATYRNCIWKTSKKTIIGHVPHHRNRWLPVVHQG